MSNDSRHGTPKDGTTAPADPTIPDGGLGEAMPEWLRRPPAWRGMPALDSPPAADEPSEAARADANSDTRPPAPEIESDVAIIPDDEGASISADQTNRAPRVVPSPDTSSIDPSTLIELSDLPAWLVGLGKRDVPMTRDAHADRTVDDVKTDVFVPEGGGTDASSVPLPPFLRGEWSIDTASETLDSAAESPVLSGFSRRSLTLVGVLLVVIVIAILLSVFG